MSINKRNSEGYQDPTAYEALTSVRKEEIAVKAFRPIVFICSPYAGDIEANKRAAQRYSRYAVERGCIRNPSSDRQRPLLHLRGTADHHPSAG